MRIAQGLDVQGLLVRADTALAARGWRLLVGAFMIDGELENAALMISPDLEVAKVWVLDEVAVDGEEPRPRHRKLIHGVEILADASLIYAFDGGISLQRVSRCGERLWSIGRDFHHAVTLDTTGDGVWTLGLAGLARISVDDGSIIQQISMEDIISSNPMIDILEVRRRHAPDHVGHSRNTKGTWLNDAFHLNDVDPLPAAIVDRFDGFDAGDLLVSARSLNLVFVLNPTTLKVKWWRAGLTQRQHDPDWLSNGEIMVFNNRTSRDFSEIVSIDPDTLQRTTLFDGRDNDFYTRIRGKAQRLEDGTLVVASPQQGRAFEVTPDGQVVLEIINAKPGSETTNFVISEMKWISLNSFNLDAKECVLEN
jgi:hypothetical protein